MRKRVLSALLALAMCLTLLPATALAVDDHTYDENGFCTVHPACYEPAEVVGDGCKVYNAGQLYWYAWKSNNGELETYPCLLMSDITVNPGTFDKDGKYSENGETATPRQWTPIGTKDHPFGMAFDGYGHTVSGLYYSGDAKYVGLFGVLSGGNLINITVTNSYFSTRAASAGVGGIAGFHDHATVENCHAENVNISAAASGDSGDAYAGGIAGKTNYGAVINCSHTGSVKATSTSGTAYAGGMMGNSDRESSNCYNTGSVTATGTSSVAGGVAGSGSGTASSCYYQAESETDSLEGTTCKTAAQFASGEVTWLLNGGNAEGIWKQTLGTGGSASPGFTGGTVVYNKDAGKYNNTCAQHSFQGTDCQTCGYTCKHSSFGVDGKCLCGAETAAVKIVNNNMDTLVGYYLTLEAALDAWQNSWWSDYRVVLLKDVTSGQVEKCDGWYTVDLNGHNLTLGENTNILGGDGLCIGDKVFTGNGRIIGDMTVTSVTYLKGSVQTGDVLIESGDLYVRDSVKFKNVTVDGGYFKEESQGIQVESLQINRFKNPDSDNKSYLRGGIYGKITITDPDENATLGNLLGTADYYYRDADGTKLDTSTITGKELTNVSVWKESWPFTVSGSGKTSYTYGDTVSLTAVLPVSTWKAAYQWYVDNSKIEGATSATYTAKTPDVGTHKYSVEVTIGEDSQTWRTTVTVTKAASTGGDNGNNSDNGNNNGTGCDLCPHHQYHRHQP